jgi:hypothetical protein
MTKHSLATSTPNARVRVHWFLNIDQRDISFPAPAGRRLPRFAAPCLAEKRVSDQRQKAAAAREAGTAGDHGLVRGQGLASDAVKKLPENAEKRAGHLPLAGKRSFAAPGTVPVLAVRPVPPLAGRAGGVCRLCAGERGSGVSEVVGEVAVGVGGS